MKPQAIGYIRSDISGTRQQWDESQIRSLAKRLGYDLRKTAAFSENTDRPIHRLRVMLDRLGVDTIITPSIAHLDNDVPPELTDVTEIITVDPQTTYARRPLAAEGSAR